MQILTRPRPHAATGQPLPDGMHLILQPKARAGFGASILAGLALPFLPFVILSVESWLKPAAASDMTETVSWWIVIPAVLVTVVLHEALHLLFHPGWGASPRSLVLFWPGKLQLGVTYDGFMSRSRWLTMRLAPLFGLTVLPMLFLIAFYPGFVNFFWRQFTVLVILVNSLGAGGDLVASWIVSRQVPRGGEIGPWNGRACWRKQQ